MAISERRRLTFTAMAVTLVGIIIGFLLSVVSASGAPPTTKTFNVIAYHWGYAIFDENWNEIEQMEVKLGSTVRLIAYPVTLFSQKLQDEFHQRVVDKGLSISLVKGVEIKLPPGDPSIANIVREAHMNPDTLNHGVSIEEFNVDLSPQADKSTWKGAIDSIEFTPDALGTFKISCSIECGPGHEFFALMNALVVVK